MAGGLPGSITDFYDSKVVEAYYAPLIGTNLIAKGADLPPGTETVSRDVAQPKEGKAKRGYKIRDIPRETSERKPKTVLVVEHAYGYDMHKKKLDAYARMGEAALNGIDAYNAGRIVGESLDDIIFNGDAEIGAKGILTSASLTPYSVDEGAEWNQSTGADISGDFTRMNAQLEESELYIGMQKKLALCPAAYNMLLNRVPYTMSTYMDYIAKFFTNGVNDIYRTTSLASGKGLLMYFNPIIAERNVEQDILTYAVNNGIPDKNNMINFNVDTYQAIDIHKPDAFLPLENLIDPAA
ncbi:MAG: DUF2184 domain-containing protein [Methanobacterium paludis]|nr:DUF2184 domain-containing protein [Methanobacterium paludis]